MVISLVLKKILFELKGMIPSSDMCQNSKLLNYRSKTHTCTQVIDKFTDSMDQIQEHKSVAIFRQQVNDYINKYQPVCKVCIKSITENYLPVCGEKAPNVFGPGALPYACAVYDFCAYRGSRYAEEADMYNRIEFVSHNDKNVQFLVYGNVPEILFYQIPYSLVQTLELAAEPATLVAYPTQRLLGQFTNGMLHEDHFLDYECQNWNTRRVLDENVVKQSPYLF